MFTCASCGITQLPNTPMNKKVVETKVREYINYDAEGEEHVSQGQEIVKEIPVCAACLGQAAASKPASKGDEVALLIKQAKLRHQHAAGCKKDINECKVCRASVAWFAALPPQQLSQVLGG